jgi:hypothetical protein
MHRAFRHFLRRGGVRLFRTCPASEEVHVKFSDPILLRWKYLVYYVDKGLSVVLA